MYESKFRNLLATTATGYGIGLVAAIALTFLFGITGVDFITMVLVLTIIFGSVVSMIICAKMGTQGFLNAAVVKIWSGFKHMFFGAIVFSNVPIFFVIGIFKFIIGLLILIPVGIYMAFSYLCNFIYLAIMFALERHHMLDNHERLCRILDFLVPILSGVLTIAVCYKLLNS